MNPELLTVIYSMNTGTAWRNMRYAVIVGDAAAKRDALAHVQTLIDVNGARLVRVDYAGKSEIGSHIKLLRSLQTLLAVPALAIVPKTKPADTPPADTPPAETTPPADTQPPDSVELGKLETDLTDVTDELQKIIDEKSGDAPPSDTDEHVDIAAAPPPPPAHA